MGLASVPLQYRHVFTSLPSPIECAKKMNYILQEEGIIQNKASANLKALAWVAELCGCDIRRILLELQMFSCGGQHRDSSAARSSWSTNTTLPTPENKKAATVDQISPNVVPSEKSVVLTICGQNFLSLCKNASPGSIEVIVGEQVCPAASIVDDTTILAVCPPCSRPHGVNRYGLRQTSSGNRRASLHTRYATLSLVPSPLTDFTSTRSISLVDGNSVVVKSPCNVEYSFPEDAAAISDDDEIEFEEDHNAPTCSWLDNQASCLAKWKHPQPKIWQDEDIKEANGMLMPQLKMLARTSEESPVWVPDRPKHTQIKPNDDRMLDQLVRECELNSDAAVLEGHVGFPFLAGASPGFGYRFTPEEQSRHGNATQ